MRRAIRSVLVFCSVLAIAGNAVAAPVVNCGDTAPIQGLEDPTPGFCQIVDEIDPAGLHEGPSFQDDLHGNRSVDVVRLLSPIVRSILWVLSWLG